MSTFTNDCPEVAMTGNCTQGEDCTFCNKSKVQDFNFNVNAKSYVPKSKRLNKEENKNTNNKNEELSNNFESKLKLNLDASEYIPNKQIQVPDYPEYTVNDLEDYDGDEFDMIMKDIIDNEVMEEEEEESDDEKWFPRFKECECCRGYVYKCKGTACVNLGVCYCKMKDECDDEDS